MTKYFTYSKSSAQFLNESELVIPDNCGIKGQKNIPLLNERIFINFIIRPIFKNLKLCHLQFHE
jgi:hypothetical protein